MDVQNVISLLKAERDRINQAITILEGSLAHRSQTGNRHRAAVAAPRRIASTRHEPAVRKGRSRLSPEGGKKLSRLMKQRWAEKRRVARA